MAEVVKEKVNGILVKYPVIDEPLKTAASKIGVDKAFVAIGICVLVPLILSFFLSFGTLFIDIVGFVFPMYASIKAIESPSTEDDTLWLTYWLVFAIFKILESSADFMLSMIPFYSLIKATFLVWCYYPKTQGAKFIYSAVIKPHLVPLLGLQDAAKKEE